MATINASELSIQFSTDRKPEEVGFLTVLRSSLIKDIQIQMRYKQNFVSQFIRTMLFILTFYLFSLSFAFDDLPDQSTQTVFLFYISALILMMYDGVAMWSPYNSVRRDLYNGTLESIYQSPASRAAYYLGGIMAQSIYSSVFVIPLLLTIILVFQPSMITLGIVFITIAIALCGLMAMGILIALSAILWKNMGAFVNILGMVFQFATGTIIPFASLPVWAQYVGYFLPITWGLDLIRYYLFGSVWTTIYTVPVMWVILIGQVVLFFLVAKFLLVRVEKYSKKQGLHLL